MCMVCISLAMARSANKLPHQTENDKPNFAKLPFKIVTFIRHILRSNKLKALHYIHICDLISTQCNLQIQFNNEIVDIYL